MTLKNSEIGKCYQVTALKIEGNLLRRLQSLGLTIGTAVRVLNRKKNGPVIISVRGTRFAIGGQIAENIEAKEVIQGGREHE